MLILKFWVGEKSDLSALAADADSFIFSGRFYLIMETRFLGVPDVGRLIFIGLSVASLFTSFTVAALGGALGGQIFVALPTATLQFILGIFIIVFTSMPKIANTGSLQGRFGVIGYIATFVGIFVSAVGALVAPLVAPRRQKFIVLGF